MAHKIVNGVQVELTAAEVTAMEEQAVAWEAGAFDRAMANLRQKRNALLSASDYTQLQDIGFNSAERNAWMNYRQALRDITNNIETVEQANSINFPTKP